jgi:HSF-type DNA-binding
MRASYVSLVTCCRLSVSLSLALSPDTMESPSSRNIVSFDASSLLLDAATTLAQLAQCASEKSVEKQLVSAKTTVSQDQRGINAEQKTPDLFSLPKWKSVFPLRLWELLNDETNNASVIGWLPHGQSFIVHQPQVLMTKVLPKFIPMAPGSSSTKTRVPKFVSFTRKLHRWYVGMAFFMFVHHCGIAESFNAHWSFCASIGDFVKRLVDPKPARTRIHCFVATSPNGVSK